MKWPSFNCYVPGAGGGHAGYAATAMAGTTASATPAVSWSVLLSTGRECRGINKRVEEVEGPTADLLATRTLNGNYVISVRDEKWRIRRPRPGPAYKLSGPGAAEAEALAGRSGGGEAGGRRAEEAGPLLLLLHEWMSEHGTYSLSDTSEEWGPDTLRLESGVRVVLPPNRLGPRLLHYRTTTPRRAVHPASNGPRTESPKPPPFMIPQFILFFFFTVLKLYKFRLVI